MLSLLKSNNLALIEEVVWEMGPGLIGITGETGSGKSMVIGALKLIVGQRADTELIRTGEDTCTVEAIFDLKDCSDINIILDELGLEPISQSKKYIEATYNDYRVKNALIGDRWSYNSYPQVFEDRNGFIEGRSVLDAIFHGGPEAKRWWSDVSLQLK